MDKQIYKCIEDGLLDEVEKLLEASPQLATRIDNDGRTILQHAITLKQSLIVKYLMARFKFPLDIGDENGWRPLHTASSVGNLEVATCLLDYCSEDGAGEQKRIVDLCNHSGHSALFYAVSKGHEGIVDILLDAGASMEIRDQLGQTVLHRAATLGRTTLVAKLLERKQRQVIIPPTNSNNNDIGVETGTKSDVKKGSRRMGFELGEWVNWRDNVNGNTALHLAVEEGHEAIVELLLANGADRDIKNNDGQTAKDLAQIRRMQQVL